MRLLRLAPIVLALAVGVGRAQPAPEPLKPMPFPPELDGSLATTYVVPFGLPKVSFSADLHMQMDQSVTEGREIYIPYRERRDMRSKNLNFASVIYTDLLVGYGIDYLHKTYIETDFRQSRLQPNRTDSAYAATWLVARDGEDVDDGLVRTRYRIENSRPNGDHYAGIAWVADGYNLIVQGEGVVTSRGVSHTVHFKLSNIQVGPQDPALFAPPADFRRIGTGLSPFGPSRTDYEGVQP
jgi:hypothetical protein